MVFIIALSNCTREIGVGNFKSMPALSGVSICLVKLFSPVADIMSEFVKCHCAQRKG